jgi:membrane carboxypeptidase/penicillin-binding protein
MPTGPSRRATGAALISSARIVRDTGEVIADSLDEHSVSVDDGALLLIQEGLRGVVRMPTGTAHDLDSTNFPIAVMGKTGTTNNFKDALFVGSTYGPGGITIAVRIGFDDNHSLGPKESGARAALPVFRQIMLGVYREKLTGPAPEFPSDMEDSSAEVQTAQQVLPLPQSSGSPATEDHEGQTWWRSAGGAQKPPR